MPRSTPSNAAAMGDWPGSRPPGGASVVAAARTVVVAPRSWNGEDCPNVPAADCGTSTYSAVSTNALAANCTHPESVAGSTVTYLPALRTMGVPRPSRQDIATGPALSLHAPARPSNTAAAADR